MSEKRTGHITGHLAHNREENARLSELCELMGGDQWKPGELERVSELLDQRVMSRLAARMFGDE